MAGGVATAPNFMEEFRLSLHNKLLPLCDEVRSELLLPYGDWSRPIAAQLREVGHDMRKGSKNCHKSIGGSRILETVDERHEPPLSPNAQIILIGHSAGGVAAVHAAQCLLEREANLHGQPCLVVMIGSPRCPIPPSLRESVLYLHASQGARDPIIRIGTFGGWRLGKYRLPIWHKSKHAPTAAIGLPIIGRHPDYFRHQPPYVNAEGNSNLEITTEAVLRWLTGQLRSRSLHGATITDSMLAPPLP
jgi:hypothetical protein